MRWASLTFLLLWRFQATYLSLYNVQSSMGAATFLTVQTTTPTFVFPTHIWQRITPAMPAFLFVSLRSPVFCWRGLHPSCGVRLCTHFLGLVCLERQRYNSQRLYGKSSAQFYWLPCSCVCLRKLRCWYRQWHKRLRNFLRRSLLVVCLLSDRWDLVLAFIPGSESLLFVNFWIYCCFGNVCSSPRSFLDGTWATSVS